MTSASVATPPLIPGRNLVQTIRAIVALFAPSAAKQRMLDSMTEVVAEVTKDALRQSESRRALDALTSQPVILDAITLALDVLGIDLSTGVAKTVFGELAQRAHELLPKLSEKARTWVRATAFLGVAAMESWKDQTKPFNLIDAINSDRGEARRIAGLWIAVLAGGSIFGIPASLGEDFARELWQTIAKGADEDLVEDCYWSAAHVEAKAAA
jgi:hypothetical protein